MLARNETLTDGQLFQCVVNYLGFFQILFRKIRPGRWKHAVWGMQCGECTQCGECRVGNVQAKHVGELSRGLLSLESKEGFLYLVLPLCEEGAEARRLPSVSSTGHVLLQLSHGIRRSLQESLNLQIWRTGKHIVGR
eukprot:Hpha_TRINITY_DN18322_c0_g1::TRINITY_DN18322_c0_g1_i1::g.158232::m.158232